GEGGVGAAGKAGVGAEGRVHGRLCRARRRYRSMGVTGKCTGDVVAPARRLRRMTADECTALLAFATAMSFSPGPNTTLATALAANFGLRRALRFVVAVPAGWTVLMLACGLGLGALVLAVPAARWGVKVVGVA